MKKIDLIADSGSTKTDWSFVQKGKIIQSLHTAGMNPYLQSGAEIHEEIKANLLPSLEGFQVDTIHFYGAGCTLEKAGLMRNTIAAQISAGTIEVYSDLMASAHATCGHDAGIACILGTGSNSCFYNGGQIVKNIPPLGFILGDEGGGTALGRTLVGDVLKEALPQSIRTAFFERFKLTQADILNCVYQQPFPNRFLASLTPFLLEHVETPEIYGLVKNGFRAFLTRNVKRYDYKHLRTHFVGSVSYYFKEILQDAADSEGVTIGKILKSPMEGLIAYHFSSQ